MEDSAIEDISANAEVFDSLCKSLALDLRDTICLDALVLVNEFDLEVLAETEPFELELAMEFKLEFEFCR